MKNKQTHDCLAIKGNRLYPCSISKPKLDHKKLLSKVKKHPITCLHIVQNIDLQSPSKILESKLKPRLSILMFSNEIISYEYEESICIYLYLLKGCVTQQVRQRKQQTILLQKDKAIPKHKKDNSPRLKVILTVLAEISVFWLRCIFYDQKVSILIPSILHYPIGYINTFGGFQ